MTPEIIYSDEALIVVNKPAGMLAVPGKGEDKQDCVASRIQSLNAETKVVHRLDCHTSGIMLMAIGIEMQRELSRQFHDREVEKEYVAVVHGVIAEQEGVIDIPMRGDPDNRPRQIVDNEAGKQAITCWYTIGRNHDTTRLLLKPVTGRTHQLRLHCSMIGHPIVGDKLYGNDSDASEPRMLLHASALTITHPITGERFSLVVNADF